MKLVRAGIVVGKNNIEGYETLINVLSEPDFIELCTPVIFGSLESAEAAIKKVEPENAVTFNVLKAMNESVDGRINFIDNLSSETDAINIAVNSYLDNCVDALIVMAHEVYNDPGKQRLTATIAESMQHENKGFLDWFCNDKNRSINISSLDDIEVINKSLRWDYTLIRPRMAVISNKEELSEKIANLRENGYNIFGPFNPGKEETKDIYKKYDALLFLDELKANNQFKNSLNARQRSHGYISGLPMVLTYTLKSPETTNLKEAIYSAIDIDRARMKYRKATFSPLEKLWNPKGRDDFKLDLSATED